jgi:hypothetical protein
LRRRRSKLRSPLLKLRSPLTLLPPPLLLRLPPPLLLRPPPPLLLRPLLPLPLRLLLLPLLRLPLLRLPLPLRRSKFSPAFGQEKASLRAGFFVFDFCPSRSKIAPGESLILGRDANPLRGTIHHGRQGLLRKRRAVVLLGKMGSHNMAQT